jgi:hypothetical protein
VAVVVVHITLQRHHLVAQAAAELAVDHHQIRALQVEMAQRTQAAAVAVKVAVQLVE